MPETAAYRIHTEKLVNERLALVEKVCLNENVNPCRQLMLLSWNNRLIAAKLKKL